MLKIQSDYLSLVFVFNSDYIESNIIDLDSVNKDKYYTLINHVIKNIDDSLSLSELLGELVPTFKGGKGYNSKEQFGNSGVSVSYHDKRPEMGVLLQMSGSALHNLKASHLQEFGELIEVNDVLRALDSRIDAELGYFRISRFDAAIDLIDENVDLTTLYNALEHEMIKIYNHKENLNMSRYKSYQEGSEVQTIYIGSRQSNNMLRIYNKKEQTIERNITKDLEQAVNCDDWFRFEMEIKKESAHVLTNILLEITTLEEFQSYLLQLMTDKYRFGIKTDDEIEYIEITQKMLNAIKYKNVEIVIPRISREYDLRKKEEYFEMGNSGLQSLIYKQRALFGEDYVREWFEELLKYNQLDYIASEETERYVREIKEEQRESEL